MDSKKKVNLGNNNTSLPVQTKTQWRRKLMQEVNMKYRCFSETTDINHYKARILTIKEIEKPEQIEGIPGLERHFSG